MSTTLDFKYRIIYESLSRFSSTLSRSTTLEEVRQCLQRQIKYLFDYQLVRFCFYQQDYYVIYSLVATGCALHDGDTTLLWEHERLLKERNVPLVIDDERMVVSSLHQLPFELKSSPTQVWGWNVGFTPDSGILVSVFSGSARQFQSTDVPILKITLENLYAKILSIRLIEELNKSKKEVDQALHSLQEKSEVISTLVATQEQVIQDRTRELEVKNAKLIYLSREHAHTIREPLSRILSLAYLIDLLPPQEVLDEIIPVLVTTSMDLDKALQQVIQTIDTEIASPD